MSYIGRGTDKISNIEILDNITFDGSSSYSITKSSVAFVPNSAQSLLISIDGVVQATNFSVSTSTIDFGVAIPSTSTCDFFLHYGTGVLFTPADGTVTEAKIGSGAVVTSKIADANVTSAKMFSGFANGITEADQWRLSANHTGSTVVSTNWERDDSSGFNYIGTGLTESSGIFSFPQTGIYLINFNALIIRQAGDSTAYTRIKITTDNSTYNEVSQIITGNADASTVYGSASISFMFNVTDITTHKFQFETSSFGTSVLVGNTTLNYTHFTTTRLGDSV